MPKRLPTPFVIGRVQAEPDLPPARDGERLVGARDLPIDQLVPDPDQPRRTMDPERLKELADSLTEHGVLQPLLVREDGYLDDGRTRYVIIAGGRRYAAAQQAGLTRLPIIVRESEGAALRVQQLVENLQRQDLAPLDEARAYQELIDAGGLSALKLAERLHVSPQTVRDRLLLLSDQLIADAVQRGQIGTAVARDILRAAPEPQAELRAQVQAGEAVTKETVKKARKRAESAGVVNPRKTGGGRKKDDAASSGEGTMHTDYASPPLVQGAQTPSSPSVAATVRALVDSVEASELRAYIDAQTAQDARYSPAADSYALGFRAALTALQRALDESRER